MNNKEETIKDYQERINKVLIYINNNLEEKLKLEVLAGISNFSPFHFHRIMRAYLNEPIGSYISRVRLETAARLLKFSKNPVNEIAYKIGYDTPSSFTKAFKKRFNYSPAEFREVIKEYFPEKYSPPINQSKLNFGLKPKIKLLKAKKVVFIQSIGKYSGQGTENAWTDIWTFIKINKLFSWKMESFGIGHDDPNITEENNCRYDACVTINRIIIPEGKVGFKEIDGGKYAIFRYKGSYEFFNEVYNMIYRDWYPTSGFKFRESPAFEKYFNNPKDTKSEKLITDIYIPVY